MGLVEIAYPPLGEAHRNEGIMNQGKIGRASSCYIEFLPEGLTGVIIKTLLGREGNKRFLC